jgi:Ig-like domain-containing protein
MKLIFRLPRTVVTACFVIVIGAGGASSAAAQTCGEMGGDECMQSGPCPPGYESLGPSEDCPGACCVRGPSCGERGGEECMQTGPCPTGYQSLGPTWDCPAACCDYVDPGPTCTDMGGEMCGPGGHCGVYHESIGPSSDCGTCCRRLPSCGSLGGPEAECGQNGVCPPGYAYLSASGDCNPCCEPVTPPATDGAAVAAVNLPTSMNCGSTYDAWVRMTNTGNTTWTSGGGYKLGTVGDQDPLHTLTRVYLPDGVSVPPGGSHTFYMTLTAPGSAGTVVTDWQMVNDPGGWFGGIASRSVSISCAPPDTDGAQVASVNLPTSLSCGATYAASVTMANTGTTTWTSAGEYKLGTVGDQDPFFAATRIYLPDGASVPPGGNHTFTMTLTAPASAGTFVTDWRMVHDPVGWFGPERQRQLHPGDRQRPGGGGGYRPAAGLELRCDVRGDGHHAEHRLHDVDHGRRIQAGRGGRQRPVLPGHPRIPSRGRVRASRREPHVPHHAHGPAGKRHSPHRLADGA